jgi:hypothetical protein
MKYFNAVGLLSLRNVGDSDNVLFLSSLKNPLIDELQDFLPYVSKYNTNKKEKKYCKCKILDF